MKRKLIQNEYDRVFQSTKKGKETWSILRLWGPYEEVLTVREISERLEISIRTIYRRLSEFSKDYPVVYQELKTARRQERCPNHESQDALDHCQFGLKDLSDDGVVYFSSVDE
jgi:hypothetical protein